MSAALWIGRLNTSAACWGDAMWRACWQGGLAALTVWLVCLCWKRMPVPLRYGLWWAVCLKLVLGLSPALFRLPVLPPITHAAVAVDAHVARSVEQPPPVFDTAGSRAQIPDRVRSHASSPRLTISGAAWLMFLWLSVITALAGVSVASVFRLRRIVRGAAPLSDPALLEIVRDAASSMGMRTSPRVLITQFDTSVLTLGVLRPVVLLSERTLTCCEIPELKLVLSHEFAHIRRGDAWLGLLPHLTKILFWFHPMAWLAWHEVDVAREAACDEQTITRLNARSDMYGRLLLKLGVRQTSWLSLCTPGVSSHYRILHRRLSMLQEIHASPRRLRGRVVMAACLIGVAAAVPWSVVHAQSSGSQTSGTNSKAATVAAVSRMSTAGRKITTASGNHVQGSLAAKLAAPGNVTVTGTGNVTVSGAGLKSGSSATTRAASKTGSDTWHAVFMANHAGSDAQKRLTTLFPLKYAEASSVAKTLSSLFEEDDKKNVKIVVDVRTNTVIIQATAEKLNEIRPVLDHIDSTEVTVGARQGPATIINLK